MKLKHQHVVLAIFAALMLGLIIQRVWRYSTYAPQEMLVMPSSRTKNDERVLFQQPGGKYTFADIATNGQTLPSQKYRSFRAIHDFLPRSGDRLCPITRTKANRGCTWIVNGETYEFCCPPCISEFVQLAKDEPNSIRPAIEYVKR